MKLSEKSKLGLAIAAGFISLSAYVVAQSPASPNDYGPMNNPGLGQMNSQGLSSVEFGRTNAEDQRMKFDSSSPTTTEETTITTKKGKKKTVTKGKSNSSHRVSPSTRQ